MNQSQKDGAATLMGIIAVTFVVIIISLSFAIGFEYKEFLNKTQAAPAGSTEEIADRAPTSTDAESGQVNEDGPSPAHPWCGNFPPEPCSAMTSTSIHFAPALVLPVPTDTQWDEGGWEGIYLKCPDGFIHGWFSYTSADILPYYEWGCYEINPHNNQRLLTN